MAQATGQAAMEAMRRTFALTGEERKSLADGCQCQFCKWHGPQQGGAIVIHTGIDANRDR